MNKTGIWILCVSAVFLLLTNVAIAETDWAKTGISDTGRVRKIVQITNHAYDEYTITGWDQNNDGYMLNPWSSDGDWIVYSGNVGTNDAEICKIKANGSGFQQLTDNSVDDSNAQFTPDGSKIVFSRQWASGESIYIMDSSGSGETDLTAAHSGTNSETNPLISPDGTKIAYYSNSAIWVMNLNGTSNTQVSVVTAKAEFCWSPDSTKIAYSGWYTAASAYKIYTVNSNGIGNLRIGSSTTSLYETWPIWSPDGTKIAYRTNIYSTYTTYALMQRDAAGSTEEVLVQEDDNAGDWGKIYGQTSWSPDSKWIVYGKDKIVSTYGCSIFIVNRYTGEEIQLTNSYYDYSPMWSPDGRSILFEDSNSSGSSRDGGSYGDLLLLKLIPRSISAVNSLILY